MISYVGPIEETTYKDTYFRHVFFCGKRSRQLAVVNLDPWEDIGDEVHQSVDQFFRISEGNAKFVINSDEEHLLRRGEAITVPAGIHHNVINASASKPLKLYTIFSPPDHPYSTLHMTLAAAKAAADV